MKNRIRIAMVTNHLAITGISAVIMNYCKSLDHNKFALTIVAGYPVEKTYKDECKNNGIEIVELPSRSLKTLKHYSKMWKCFQSGKYDIIHIHGNSSIMAIELLIAKLAGVKVLIAHSHNSTCPNLYIHRVLHPIFSKLITKGFACSSLAGNWLFGEGCFDIIPNGFNTRQFIFNPINRNIVRKELDLEGKFVIGHIGRFNHQKNHDFLLEVFELIVADYDNVVLLLVGNGPDLKKVKDKANMSRYSSHIILYGETSKTERLYSAMDMFAFPSRYEGLGIVMLEAQIGGLPCVASDAVPREVAICPYVYFLPIEEYNIVTWKEQIIDIMQKEYDRENVLELYQDYIARYNITDCARLLERKYIELVKKICES